MPRKPKFRPEIRRIKLNPEQAVLQCTCYSTGESNFVGARYYLDYAQAYINCYIGRATAPREHTACTAADVGRGSTTSQKMLTDASS